MHNTSLFVRVASEPNGLGLSHILQPFNDGGVVLLRPINVRFNALHRLCDNAAFLRYVLGNKLLELQGEERIKIGQFHQQINRTVFNSYSVLAFLKVYIRITYIFSGGGPKLRNKQNTVDCE